MKSFLIVASGKRKGFPIPIQADLFMIGSGKECQLRCKTPGTPPRQCAIVIRDKKIFVRDLNSGEPTLINDSLLPPGEEWPLHPGDRLSAGKLEFILQLQNKPLAQKDLEEWALNSLDMATQEREDPDDEELMTARRPRASTPSEAAAAILGKLSSLRGEVVGRLRIIQEGTITVIRFNDRYLVDEAEITLINKELHDHLNKANMRVLLDCKNVRRMSTAAVAMLDDLCTWLKPWGSTLALCRIRPELQEILRRLLLQNKIPHFSDRESALAARW
jgi:anti-anti-sigma regulatory factor